MRTLYPGIGRQRHLNGPAWPFTRNDHSVQAQSLTGWYPMLSWEVDGLFRDFSEIAQHIVSGDAPSANGLSSLGRPSFTYDGVNDNTEAYQIQDYMTATNGAWSCWARPLSSSYESASPAYELPHVVGDASGYAGIVVGDLGGSTGQAFHAYVYDGATPAVSSPVITLYQWYHVLAAVNGGNLYLYINGKSVGSTAAGSIASTAGLFYFGAGYGGRPNIEIADVRFYDYKPDDDTIWQMYDPRTRWELYRPAPYTLTIADTVAEVGGGSTARHGLLLGVGF